jgi:cellulose synthase/poly-beta-1,6-N-acetylglucosamine synthase-like glycosyltransferase
VASLQTGSFRRDVLERVGPFDESLAIVEDLDINTRIRKAGYTLLLDPSIRFWYVPRHNLSALWRQIHAVGRIKIRVLLKHRDIFKLKYVLPSVFVLALAAAGLAIAATAGGAPLWLGGLGALFLAAYAAVVVAFAASRIARIGLPALWLLGIVPTLHIGYGTGFIRGASSVLRRSIFS